MKKLIPVDSRPDLRRDPRSGAILNINKSEIQNARAAKAARLAKQEQDAQLRNDVDNLKDDVKDIKGMLAQLIEKL
jgi:hypothetical protein